MRSYFEHLQATKPSSLIGNLSTKPHFRSSAIFPVMHTQNITARLLFMGYWILKRHISEITALCTLRSSQGLTIARTQINVKEAKTFRIELTDLLKLAGLDERKDFYGSIEIEFFSTQNLVFPFPAVVINTYGPKFSTVVHTAQRVYNDFEDMVANSQTAVPESGFNIYVDKDQEPIIGLINGPISVEKSRVNLQFFNGNQQTLDGQIDLGTLNPYETRWIYPARSFDLQHFLDNHPGTCKVSFMVNWVFPRLLVGNIHHNIPALTITHTYYDCTLAETESDYWQSGDIAHYPASLMVPALIANNHFTNVYFYPIYSPASFAVDIEIYSNEGALIGSKQDVLTISPTESKFHQIPITDLLYDLNLSKEANHAARIIARPIKHSRIPARIKLGLDIGIKGKKTPCNICTNLAPFNPALEEKPSSFRWAPILADQNVATVWIMNSSPSIHYQKEAKVDATFFREEDNQTIKRTLAISPNGFIVITIGDDPELKTFFNDRVGWMTAVTSNPYTSVYYFTESSSGVVGGDHGF